MNSNSFLIDSILVFSCLMKDRDAIKHTIEINAHVTAMHNSIMRLFSLIASLGRLIHVIKPDKEPPQKIDAKTSHRLVLKRQSFTVFLSRIQSRLSMAKVTVLVGKNT